MIDDRKLAHDLRNSVMVIRNLSELLEQEKLQGKEREQAYAIIKAECEKLLDMTRKP
jgi:signal transduction histidine kinase